MATFSAKDDDDVIFVRLRRESSVGEKSEGNEGKFQRYFFSLVLGVDARAHTHIDTHL